MTSLSDIQQHVGVPADGQLGPVTLSAIARALGMGKPFDKAAFLARYVNKSADAISDADIDNAADRLNVSPAHIRMVRTVESGGKSFDDSGRPVILFEPHIFHRRTAGKYSPSSFSYTKWRTKPYPKTYDDRWQQMADAAERDEEAALESASWGLFQIMGFHWADLGYASAVEFAKRMTHSESEHLEAVVRFIEKNGLAPALRRCKAGDPNSCRDFAKGYNGSGYTTHNYHGKMAGALK